MKLFETSLLELIATPLKKIKIVNDYWGGNPAQAPNYEHIFTPCVVMSFFAQAPFCLKLTAWLAVLVWHLVLKEFIIDPIVFKKQFNWPNVIERGYGMILAIVGLF